jgi:hypothetical protein
MADCLHCSNEIKRKPTGRTPIYCSNACRVAAFRICNKTRNETPLLSNETPATHFNEASNVINLGNVTDIEILTEARRILSDSGCDVLKAQEKNNWLGIY